MKTFPMRTNKNLIVAETFLDMFGLSFDHGDLFTTGEHALITNNAKDQVGRIDSIYETILIEAATPLGSLQARFPVIYPQSISAPIIFSNTVSYEILLSNGKNLKGECTIDFTTLELDNVIGLARHKLYLLDGQKVETEIAIKDAYSFQVKFYGPSTFERISFDLNPESSEYIIHKNGKIKRSEPYVCCDKKGIETFDKDESKLHVFHRVSENGTGRFLTGDFIDKKPRKEENSNQDDPFIIQLGAIMQKLDYDVVEKLASLRNSLNNGDTNLLDELINTSLTGFTDNELKALFGFIPKLEREPEKRYTFLPIKK
ncbi:MAG TPA: hypothetical protein DCY94_01990 [Firmicutes bacterium]|nr:hypothetical protein [Bacillota bacterium]